MQFSTEITHFIAVGIGILVSLDVVGLLISQHEEFRGDNFGKRMWWNALLHATTHSALFLAYFYLVGLSLDAIPDFIINFIAKLKIFKDMFENLNGPAIVKTTLLLFSIFIVVFVWFTYAGKIIENHSEKTSADKNYISNARIDVRIIYQMLYAIKVNFIRKRLFRIAMALAVAVDMLAITSFIRVFFPEAKDASNLDGTKSGSLPHFHFGYEDLPNPLVFSLIIFLSVLICAICATVIARSCSDERNLKILKWMRFIEPLLVFWLLILSIDHLFGNEIQSFRQYIVKVVFALPMATLFVYFLIAHHGKNKILEAIKSGYLNPPKGYGLNSVPFDDKNFRASFISFFKFIFGAMLLLTTTFLFSHRSDGAGLDDFLNWISIIASLAALIFLFIPPTKSFSDFEIRISLWLHRSQHGDKRSMIGSPVLIVLVFFSMIATIHFSFVGFDFFKVSQKEEYLFPMLTVGAIGSTTWILLWIRSLRKSNYPEDKDNYNRHHFNRNLSDVLTAFALVVFAWQSYQLIL